MQEDREAVKKAFRDADKNGDGKMTKDECKELFLELFPGNWSLDDLDDLFEAADIDQNGYLDSCEFVDWIYSVEGAEIPEESDGPKHNGTLRFSEDADVVDAASTAVEGPKRSVRARINTGFEFDNRQGLHFNDLPEQLDAASSASEGPKRSVRQRINTGFAREDDMPETTKRAPQFMENVQELEAASLASEGSKRSVRSRINTGFEKSDNASARDAPKGGLKFSDTAEELDAASFASDGPKRSVRARINTGFEKECASDKDNRSPQFNDNSEELEAASSATGSGRSVRNRVNTGYEKKAKANALKFDEAAEELEAASEATGGPKKSVRSRINTGFEREDDVPKEQRKPLQFNDTAEEFEAASNAAEKSRSVRARINTGFEKKVLPPEDSDRRGLQFNESREELDAASSASGSGKTVRGRINTGFASGGEAPKENRAPLIFDDAVEHHDAASEASANPRSTRTRVNTGFFTPESPDDPTEEAVGTSSLQFNESAEVFDAASASASGPGRKCRSRINTGFILAADSDEEEEPLDIHTRLSIKRQSRMSQKFSLRSSITSFQEQGAQAIHMNAMCHALSLANDLAPDSPEYTIDEREITEDVDKNQELLRKSLRKNHLFEDLEDETIHDLMEEMCVYQYDDGEMAIRQGDAGGTHFFVVARGLFEVVKDDVIVAEIAAGATFGESVLLGDGVRQATVRAKGSGQLYGMLAADVRDMMQMRYEEKYKETMNAVVKVLDSGSCAQLLKLNAFQRHELYTATTIRTLSEGEILLNAGPVAANEVYVLVQGSLVMTVDGEDLKNGRVPRYSMVGMEALLFGTMRFCIKADSVVKLLVISRSCLEELLTPSRMPTVLLRPLVDRELSKEVQIQSLHEEQRKLLTKSFVIRKIANGEDFDASDVRLLVCLEGEIEASTDGFASNITKIQSAKSNVVGLDKFFQPSSAWNLQVRIADASKPAFAAVWNSDSMNDVLAECDKGGKIRILKHVFLFRTLSKSQLMTLASAMEMKRYAPDDIIFSQGDMGDTFCIIDKGRVFIEKDGRYIRALGADDYFGERALLTREPRSATIKASQDCEIWSISSRDFTEALPPAALQYLRGRAELQDAEYKLEDLVFTRVVGTGGFGTVKMVKTAAKGIRYAMKCIKKRPIVEHKQQQAILNEKDVLLSMDHPFIVRLVQTFRNKAYVYFLMELITGGELLDALGSLGGEMNKVQTQFYAGSIILALEHLHSRRIAYLDLKSENVMLDHQGYIKLVDFGLAEKVEGGLYGAKGTPHFMAPEMLTSRSPYDTTADLWALGVSIFEFMCGELPFGKDSNSKSAVFAEVLKAEYVFSQTFQEKPYAPEAMSLINGLLCTDPKRRLGGGLAGFKALFEHVFFKGFFWDDLLARRLTPPYVPEGERYAEGRNKDPMAGQKLSEVEEKAEKEELKSGWKDPEPGWDDDFSPGDDE